MADRLSAETASAVVGNHIKKEDAPPYQSVASSFKQTIAQGDKNLGGRQPRSWTMFI